MGSSRGGGRRARGGSRSGRRFRVLGVLKVVLVDLLLQFHGRLVELVGLVGEDKLSGPVVEEVRVDSRLVEVGVLVGQSVLVVVSLRQVNLNSILVVLVVLVFQSLLEVLPVRQVSLSFVVVEDALSSLVIRAIRVCERFLQVLRFAKVLQDGKAVELVFLVSECGLVEFEVLEFLGGDLLCVAYMFLVCGQNGLVEVTVGVGAVGLMGDLSVRGVGRQWGLRGRLRGLRGSLQNKILMSYTSAVIIFNPTYRGSLTSLEVLEVFPSFKVQVLNVTGVKRRVGTSLQVHIVELASREVVTNFTSLNIVLGLTGKRGGNCGSTEEGDSEESDFGSVLHDVLVIRGLEKLSERPDYYEVDNGHGC